MLNEFALLCRCKFKVYSFVPPIFVVFFKQLTDSAIVADGMTVEMVLANIPQLNIGKWSTLAPISHYRQQIGPVLSQA